MSSRIVEHKGKKILYNDFSRCNKEQLDQAIAQAKAAIQGLPPASVRLLTDVRETEMSRATSAQIKDYSSHNTPFVARSAVVGVSGLKKLIYNTIVAVTGRSISLFDTVEQALDWLAEE
jgi:hypothetical protein